MEIRKTIRLPEDLAQRIDTARGFEPWGSFVKRALEKVLSDAQGSTSLEQAGPDPVVSSEAVRPAAPSRAPRGSPSPSLRRFMNE